MVLSKVEGRLTSTVSYQSAWRESRICGHYPTKKRTAALCEDSLERKA